MNELFGPDRPKLYVSFARSATDELRVEDHYLWGCSTQNIFGVYKLMKPLKCIYVK